MVTVENRILKHEVMWKKMEEERHNTLKDFKSVPCEDVCPDFCVGRERLKEEEREEAIKWIRSFNGTPPSEKEDNATWETITDIKRIRGYSGDDYKLELAVKWGIEEGAILMLMEFFDITEDDLIDKDIAGSVTRRK